MINKIKNNVFFKSTIILLIGGVFTKIVGFIIKLILTRNIGTEGMGVYSLLSGLTGFLTTLATFSYPSAISKVISEKSSDTRSLYSSIIPFSILMNIIILIIMYFLSPVLCYLFKNDKLYYPIIFLTLTMPFISISSIIKGYFWGNQNMFPYMLSNFIEQLSRFIIILLFINKLPNYIYKICFIMIVNIIGEIISQIVMLKFIKNKKINFKININDIKNVLSISIPSTTSKLIGSFSYMLEPIILTNILLYVGYSKEYIVYEYGVINAYSLSLLLLPQFFIQNISTSLISELSKYHSIKRNDMCIKRIKQIIYLSITIGLVSTTIITLFPKFFLTLLFNTTEGIDYIRLLSVFTILFYIEYPLISSMQALGLSKKAMYITIKTSIIRLLSIIVFSLLKVGMYSLIISIILNLIISTYLYYKEIKKELVRSNS